MADAGDKGSDSDRIGQSEAVKSKGEQVAVAVDSITRLIGAVRSPAQFAAMTIIAVVVIEMAVFSLLRDKMDTVQLLIALGLPFLLIGFLAWLWSRTLGAHEGAEIAADGNDGADAGEATETLESPETLYVGKKTDVIGAYDPVLRRNVIKKVLKSGEDREEFIDSARTAMRLSNLPNYIKIYSASIARNEPPHLVMQYLEGGDLHNYIEKNGACLLALDDVRRIVHRVGAALQNAHQRTVPLGNIKPTNIILDDENEPHLSPRVRLTFLRPAQLNEAVRDRTVSLEDLVYTAPELFASHGSDALSHDLSDQYSLGILAYHLLTCSLPRTLPTIDSTPESARVEKSCALLQQRGAAAFQELPYMHELRSGVPIKVSNTFKKIVSLNPADRYDRLDLALRAMRSAEQTTLIAARDSYTRCLANDHKQTFFERFYAEFTSNEKIAARFDNFDRDSWTAQHGKLQRAIDASFDFVKDFVAAVDFEEPNAMSGYARQHADFGIDKAEYEWFVDALVRTVCGTKEHPPFDPECEDKERAEEIGRCWRESMGPVVRYFTSKGNVAGRQSLTLV